MIKLVPSPSKKVQANIPEATHDFFFGNRGVLYGVDGAQTHVINKIFKLLHDELTARGITEFDFDNDSRVERILNQLTFITRTEVQPGGNSPVPNGLSDPPPCGQAAPRDVPGGTPSVHPGETSTPNLTPSSESQGEKHLGPSGGKRGKAKAKPEANQKRSTGVK